MEEKILALPPREERAEDATEDNVYEDNVYIEEKAEENTAEKLKEADEAKEVTEAEVKAAPLPAVGAVPASVERERRRLLFGLVCTLFGAVAVTVYGTFAALIGKSFVPLPERLMGEVLGVPVYVAETQEPPSLDKIPPQTVGEDDLPGAAEQENAPEDVPTEPAHGERLPIMNVDFSVGDDPFAIINETPYAPDVTALLGSPSSMPTLDGLRENYGEDAPFVLILHTHGTEAYSPHLADAYDSAESFRSLDAEAGVVSVGREMKRVFESHGIGTVHIETMFDAESFNDAYYFAAQEIRRVMRENPSITYFFDVHRDAMVDSAGAALRPISPSTSTVDGVSAAQIMLVVGTDHAGSGHTLWEENFSFALKLQKASLEFDPDLMRPLNLRSPSFNQQYSAQSLLVEIGSAANSVLEARLAGMIFAEAASRVIEGFAGI